MRLISYHTPSGLRSGVLDGDEVVDIHDAAAAAHGLGASARAVVALGAARLADLAASSRDRRPMAEVRLGPPVWNPEKIICLGLNYREHAAEAGLAAPAAPMFFAKFANSLCGPSDEIVPPKASEMVDYEAELAVVIGTAGRNIAAADALGHVFGAMALNDVSARDLQLANNLWSGGKAIDTFAPVAPALVSSDELGDLQALGLRTRVNGETVQDGSTESQIFGIADTIAFLSRIMTLQPGDIIATGTPAGVGNSRDPKLFLHAGDVVEVEVDGIGTLRNLVAASI